MVSSELWNKAGAHVPGRELNFKNETVSCSVLYREHEFIIQI